MENMHTDVTESRVKLGVCALKLATSVLECVRNVKNNKNVSNN